MYSTLDTDTTYLYFIYFPIRICNIKRHGSANDSNSLKVFKSKMQKITMV